MEKNNLENKILEKIKSENLKPTPFWYFLAKDYSLWGMVFVSIVLVSLCFAPIIFTIQNIEFGYIKHISANIPLFLLMIFPYPLFVLCLVTTYFAKISWEKTKHGYRFDGRKILAGSIATSLLLGVLLNYFDYGRDIDDEFRLNSFGMYKGFEQRRNDNWFNPDEGRIIGVVNTISTSSFTIDNDDKNFHEEVFFDESVPGEEFVVANNKIRIIGFQNDATDFLACAIFPDNFKPNKMRPPDVAKKQEIQNKIKNIMELHPECKDVMDKGRANFAKPVLK